jgi:hypothetical protein
MLWQLAYAGKLSDPSSYSRLEGFLGAFVRCYSSFTMQLHGLNEL